MQSKSLNHDVAWEGAASVLEVFAPLLREEEKVTAFGEVYDRIRAALESFQERYDRMRKRVTPSDY